MLESFNLIVTHEDIKSQVSPNLGCGCAIHHALQPLFPGVRVDAQYSNIRIGSYTFVCSPVVEDWQKRNVDSNGLNMEEITLRFDADNELVEAEDENGDWERVRD